MSFLVIKNLQTHGFNCEQNSMVVADTPSVPAIMGLVHNVFRDIPDISASEVAIIFHDSVMKPGIEKHITDGAGDKSIAGRVASIKERIVGDAELSLIIRLSYKDAEAFEDIEDQLPDIVAEALIGKRLAGGIIPYVWAEDISVISDDLESLQKELVTFSPGHFFVDATNRLLEKGRTPMEVLSDYVGWHLIDDGSGQRKRKKLFQGNFVATAIGYAGIETPVIRDTRIGEAVTVLAEGVTGMGIFLEVAPFNKKDFFCRTPIDISIHRSMVFWSMKYSQENNSYLCSGKGV